MQVCRLKLDNYRNYRHLDLEFPSGVVVFHGGNGQGKTNLMESFYYLLRGESFRPIERSSLIGPLSLEENEPQAKVSALVNDGALKHELSLQIRPHSQIFQMNHKKTSSLAVAKRFPIVLFSPESLSAIKSGPEERRRLVDSLSLNLRPQYDKIFRDYRRALRARNRLLKDFKEESIRTSIEPLLASLDGTYLPLSASVVTSRTEALHTILPELNRAARFVLENENVDISVEYLISDCNALDWNRADILTFLHKRTLELRTAELSSGTSLVGPHKHDIRILFNAKDSRFYCSQGQQRALILSVKMAQILYYYRAYQVYPMLLLDDVLSELDPIRRTNLVQFLQDVPAQIFLTTTDLSFAMDFGDRRISLYRIENGCAQAQD